MDNQHIKRAVFLGEPVNTGGPAGPASEIVTAKMYLAEQRRKRAAELKKQFRYANMNMATNGNWYPEGLKEQDRAMWDQIREGRL